MNIQVNNQPQLKCRAIWTIERFSTIDKPTGYDKIQSTELNMGVQNGHSSHWCIMLYPNGDAVERKGKITVFLKLNKSNWQIVPLINVRLSIINWMGNRSKCFEFTETFKPGDNRGNYLITREELLDEKNGFLINDTLTLECVFEVSMFDEVKKSPQLRFYENLMQTAKKDTASSYWPLYVNQKYVDTTIIVKNKNFEVHRVVLAANCNVFDKMFSHNMKESSTNTVTIDDCEPDVFEEFLRFIYTGGIKNINKVAVGLLMLAEKYDMEKLKYVCEKEILKNLTVNNASEMLIVSHNHNASWLKGNVLEFMKAMLREITKTVGWKEMVTYPMLMEELIKSMANTM